MNLRQRAAATDPGRRRRRNEDAYVVQPPLFAVADGMGGAQAGEIAARIAAGVLRESSAGDPIVDLIQEANRQVYEAAASDEARAGMGTTMTAALIEGDTVRIGHVGDSRAYRVSDGQLEQLTDDHSLVAELVRSGKLSQEEAETHPQRSVITRVLGTDPDVDVDTFTVDAKPGDVFMLCSDGLSSMVDDESMLKLVERNRSNLDKAARALVDAANKGGGEDNITVILFELGEGAPDDTAQLPVVEEPGADDDTTLTEADRVPTLEGDTMVVSRDELEAMIAKQEAPPRRRRRRVSRAVFALGAFAAIAIFAAVVVWTLSRSYFVGATPNGHLAVYQGFPWNVVGRVKLYRVRYESPVLAGQLSETERRKLFDHSLRSYNRALDSVKAYEAEVVP
jgi:PPM family protein phosphatase